VAFHYLGCDRDLPQEVYDWAEISTREVDFVAAFSDDGCPFADLATWIEDEL
jgi:hypothetical protein